ncbi:MAG: hypothetical protein ACI9DK_001775 [Vicingaceae bacterium]|jgi:hypothetical protein
MYRVVDLKGWLFIEARLTGEKVVDVSKLKRGTYFIQFKASGLSLKF